MTWFLIYHLELVTLGGSKFAILDISMNLEHAQRRVSFRNPAICQSEV
jgi:hypothetical protein